jgi:hypothetical protein
VIENSPRTASEQPEFLREIPQMPPKRSSAQGRLRRGQRVRFQSARACPDVTVPPTPPRTRRNRRSRPVRRDSPLVDPPSIDSPPPLPPLVVPSSDIAARNEAVSTVSNSLGTTDSLKTYLFSVQAFVDRELIYDDGDTLKLAQFNYTLQEEKLAQKLANWRGERRGELIKTRSSCCLAPNKKNGNITIEVFTRDDWAKIERCLAAFFSDRTRKNITAKWLIHWAFHQHEEKNLALVEEEEDREVIATRDIEIQEGAEGVEGATAIRPRVS